MELSNINSEENPITEFYNAAIKRQMPVDRDVRFLNYIIDFAIIFLLGRSTGYFFSYLNIISVETGKGTLYLLSFSVMFLYYFLGEWTTGRTVGKLITGTKVVTENAAAPGVWKIFVRTVFRFIPFDALSFFEYSVGWHDTWSSTLVVKVRR